MRLPKEPITRSALVTYARLLLDWLAFIYIERVLALEGQRLGVMAEPVLEGAFDSWERALREAPPSLLETKELRAVVEEALAAAQLLQSERFASQFGRVRVVELMREFGDAVDRTRFVDVRGQRFRAWLPRVLRLPDLRTGETPDDVRLRDQIQALSEDKRRGMTEFEVEPAEALVDLAPLGGLPSLRRLQIGAAPSIVDVSPLAQATGLEDLEVSAATLRDLSPLAALSRLRRLVLNVDERVDLTPLAALTQLEELSVNGGPDLSVLAGLRSLKRLTVSARRAEPDLAPLRDLVGLRELSLYSMKFESAELVRPLCSLVSLTLADCKSLVDIGALAPLTQLEKLDLSLSPVVDLAPLRFLSKLRVLDLSWTSIRAWPPLGDLPCLEELNVSGAPLAGLAGVEDGRALRKLEVGFSDMRGFADLSPLAGLTKLEELHLNSLEHIVDLSPLRGLTQLGVLNLAESGVRELTPLGAMASLQMLALPHTPIESVEPLGGLLELRDVILSGCPALRSIRPLAACPKLERLVCDDCDALQGPASLEELRAPPPRQAKRFPSAGPSTGSPGAVAAFDARGHLPKRPPEGWSIPERTPEDDKVFWLQAENSVALMLTLFGQDEEHLVTVHMWQRDGSPVADEQAARILRRLRASDAFVESEETLVSDIPGVRCFLARAHAASPDTWGAWREKPALLRVEASVESVAAGEPAMAEADVRHHLPSPLPAGWSVRSTTKDANDVACLVSAPEAEMTLLLRPVESGDGHQLVVSLTPPRGALAKSVGDATARALLELLRRRRPFEESHRGPFASARGMRVFVATVKGGGKP